MRVNGELNGCSENQSAIIINVPRWEIKGNGNIEVFCVRQDDFLKR